MRRYLIAILALVPASPALADDAAVNAIYDRMSRAYAGADAEALGAVYAPDAVVFPSATGRPVLSGRSAIVAGPGTFLTQTAASGGRLRIAFRVTERRRAGSAVLDSGVYRLTIAGPGMATNHQVGKFMTLSLPQADGQWAFAADTDTPMPAESWDAARPVDGAKFDA